MSFKDDLNEVNSRLVDLEGRARKLRNQHLADLIGHTIGRLSDAAKHPDIDNVDRVKDGEKELAPAGAPINSGGNLLFAAGDPGVKLQAEEAARRDAFAHDVANRDPASGQPLAPFFGGGNPADPNAPTREQLDAALAQLPGDYTDADYVVNGMRSHYGELFTDADEAKVRELVKPKA